MQQHKQTGRVIGILLLSMTIVGTLGLNFRGLGSSMADSVDFLPKLVEESQRHHLGIFLNVLSTAIGLWVAIVAFPVLKQHSSIIAIWYVVTWSLQFTTDMLSNLTHLDLLALGRLYADSNSIDTTHFLLAGSILIDRYFSAHLFSLMLFGAGGVPFYYLLFKASLVPGWLALWGMAAIGVLHVAAWLQLFETQVPFAFYAQNGVHLLVLTVWLLVKGFDERELS